MQDSEKILARFPGPVRLYPSRLFIVGILLLSVGGVIVLGFYVSGNYRVHANGAYGTFMSWASIVVLATLAVALLIPLLFPKTICLILDAHGFEIHRFVKSERVQWRDIRGFDTRKQWVGRGTIEQVVFVTAKGGGALPNNYGLGLQDLLHLMKAWREQAAVAHSAASGKTAPSSR